MREFLRGWRRKAGLVTLAMALVLTDMWVRSYVIRDGIQIRYPGANQFVLSAHGGIGWLNYAQSQSEPRHWIRWDSEQAPRSVTASRWGGLDVVRHWEWCGFNTASADFPPHASRPARLELWIAPYWSLVLPLTLLSAWLILIKPHKAKSLRESRDHRGLGWRHPR